MGCLVFVAYVLACVALVFLPTEAKLAVGAVAYAAIYLVIHRHRRIDAPGVRGVALRALVALMAWSLMVVPAYVFYRIRRGY